MRERLPMNGHFPTCTAPVVSASDAKGERVKDRPVYPGDLIGSIYQLLGIDTAARLPNPQGLDVHVIPLAAEGVSTGGVLREIM